MLLPVLLLIATNQADTVALTERICANCTITLERVAVLGDNDGPGALTYGTVLAVDARRRFLLAHRGAPGMFSVYGPNGRFLRTVGRSGSGPGEYTRVWNMSSSARGILVYDDLSRRSTVLDLDFNVVATRSAQERPESVIFRNDGSAILSAVVPTTDAIGFTLHEISPKGERVRSFAAPPLPYREDMRDLFVRVLNAGSDSDTYWVAHRREYAFERCAFGSEECRVFLRAANWFSAPSARDFARRNMAEDPPSPSLVGVCQDPDDDRYAWAVLIVSDPRWRTAIKPVNATEYEIVDPDRYYDSIIERIDLRTHEVVSSTRVDGRLYKFVAPGVLSRYTEDPAGIPRLEVLRLRAGHTR